MSSTNIAVIIPCYNVAQQIKNVVTTLPLSINMIVLVNDCSSDSTSVVLEEIQRENPEVIVLNHSQNKGVGGAMITGFKYVLEKNIDIIIKIDGDGQMDTSFIDVMQKQIAIHGFDYVKGNRFIKRKELHQMPFIRRIGNIGLSFFIKMASGYWNIFDPSNGFIAIHKNTLSSIDFERIHHRYFFESSMLIELYYTGAKIKDIPMPAIYADEKSNLSIYHSLFTFPPKLLKAFLRRIYLQYFVYDFNINSIYILLGIPCILFGVIFGAIQWYIHAQADTPTPTGTIMLAVISLVMGFQMVLSAIQYDIQSSNPFRRIFYDE